MIKFKAYIINKIYSLVNIYYQLQNNSITLLQSLSKKHVF